MTKVYSIEHRIYTLAHCSIIGKLKNTASFIVHDMEFYHLNFDFREGWLTNYWIARSTINQQSPIAAINVFRDRLRRIVPRISLISQAYIDYNSEPFLVHMEGQNSALFKFVRDTRAVGLMFGNKDKDSLEKLLENQDIPEEFYFYWNDATNATGYSAKLLLMFSAIEALTRKNNGKRDWDKVLEILGKDLKDEIFAPVKGLRHRLIHGEYFQESDHGKNYLLLIHKKVVHYFNSSIFKSSAISENVVNPQRNPFGNKKGAMFFVEATDGRKRFDLPELLADYDGEKFRTSDKFSIAANQTLEQH